MGHPCQPDSTMGALYEDVEKFFGDIFASYGRLVARFPCIFIGVSFVACSLFGLGMLNLKYEYHVERLYAPMESQSLSDEHKLMKLFPDHSADDFYARQLIRSGSSGSVIITTELPRDNLLVSPTLDEVVKLYHLIFNRSVYDNGRTYSYTDVCARRSGKCVVDGSEILVRHLQSNCYRKHHMNIETYVYELEPQSVYVNGSSDTASAHNCEVAHVLRLCFNLKQNSSQDRVLALKWERSFLYNLRSLEGVFHLISVSYTVSDSIDVELYEHAGRDIRLFPVAVAMVALYAMCSGSGGNWVSSHIGIALVGILGIALAILSSFGIMGLIRTPFVDICAVTPFIVLGIGMDGMSLLLCAWRKTNIRASIQERLAETFRQAALSITIMALTDLLVFCIGATSPFLSIRSFCACSGIALLFCYLNQLTFFGGCLVLHGRRVAAARHCATCLRARSRREMEEAGSHPLRIIFCSGHPPRRAGDDDNICRQLPNHVYPRIIMNNGVKCIIIFVYLAYLGLSIWGVTHLDIGFKPEEVVPAQSYMAKYIDSERHYTNTSGPVVMFVVNKPLSYERYDIQVRIRHMLHQARMSQYIDRRKSISWLDNYLRYLHKTTGGINPRDFVMKLSNEFLNKYPEHQNDIVFNADRTAIIASRFYVFAHKLLNSTAEKGFLENMRVVSRNSSLPVTVFSPSFIFFEHHVSILKNTLLTVTVTIISMLLIALMFIPHPIAVMCVTVSMLSVVLGMLGLLCFLRLTLNAIKTTQILLSIGLCSNFTVHLSHSFMTATGKSRNDRVRAALEKVGGVIIREAFILFLGIVMLAFADSYLFTSFFMCMVVVVIVGLSHSLVFLPVLLSFVGPRRSIRPKMFIPISPSCRSIGSDFSAHIYSTPSSRNGDGSQADSDMLRSNTETSNPISDIIDGSNLGLRLSYDPLDQAAEPGSSASREGYDRISDDPLLV